jgi:hypothetical protein
LFNWFVRARDWYFSQPRWVFEAVTFGLALLVGLLVMPALIYVAGRVALREYQNGGPLALYGDFLKGFFTLRESCWIVALGPYAFILLFRAFRLVLRKV